MDASTASDLAAARAALARGNLGGALRRSFEAGRRANARGDEQGLEAVVAFALEAKAVADGRHAKEATFQVEYFRQCLEHPESARRKASFLSFLTNRRSRPTEVTHKRCPECAEQIRAEAVVCRFCGHRFEAG